MCAMYELFIMFWEPFYIIKNYILFVKFSFELVFAAYCNENGDLLEINIPEKVSESCEHLFVK